MVNTYIELPGKRVAEISLHTNMANNCRGTSICSLGYLYQTNIPSQPNHYSPIRGDGNNLRYKGGVWRVRTHTNHRGEEMTVILLILLTVASGILYRMGGSASGNRLYRILGVPLCVLLSLFLLYRITVSYWWLYLILFGANAGTVSAYWGMDERKWGYWAHGLGLSLAMLPLAYISHGWVGFAIRTFVLTVGMSVWSEYSTKDVWEERGRGMLIAGTLPLLLIG